MKAVKATPEGAAPPRRRQPATTCSNILTAATAEFAAKGLEGARTDEIAARAGVNKRMLYHYFGNKEALWLAVLEHAYEAIRAEERKLDVGALDPVEGMRRLVAFSIGYDRDHPEFLALLNNENLHRAKYLRKSQRVRHLHSSLVDQIADLLVRGERQGVFRGGVDPVELYTTIAGLGFFYFANIYTLSAIFGRDLGASAARERHLAHATEVVMNYLRP
jgi:AcrR family transcriptional regulator